MSVPEETVAEVRAALDRVGGLVVPGRLDRQSPALLVRPHDGEPDGIRIFLWCDEFDRQPVLWFDAVLATWPTRQVGTAFNSWSHMRNLRRPGITVRARRVPRYFSETANPNVHAHGRIPITGDLEAACLELFAQFETLADEVSVFVAMAEKTKESASRRAMGTVGAARREPAEDLTSVLAELEAMTGIAEVKRLVRGLVETHRVNSMRAAHGLRAVDFSPHLVFTGNPGTGKTTVARIVAKAYRAIGLLDKGHLVEVDRAGLVAGYIGQTAIKTREVCEKALGGVLFIDEAYALNKDLDRDYGHEAVETLMTFMEANRGKLAVVVAGYPKEMGRFMSMNPGLQSRFDTTVHFPDFDDDELIEILSALFRAHDYRLGEGAMERFVELVGSMPRGHGFGNARDMRKLFGQIVAAHSRWVASLGGRPGVGLLRTIPAGIIPSSRRMPMETASVGGYV